jgi:transposase-like protein
VVAANAFFRKAVKCQQRCPRTIMLDGYAASQRAAPELKADGSLPGNTPELVEILEQTGRAGPSGCEAAHCYNARLQKFKGSAITIAGIELLHRIRKGQFGLGRLGFRPRLRCGNAALGLEGSAA